MCNLSDDLTKANADSSMNGVVGKPITTHQVCTM